MRMRAVRVRGEEEEEEEEEEEDNFTYQSGTRNMYLSLYLKHIVHCIEVKGHILG